MQKELPALETDRLWLRPIVPSDLAHIKRMLADPRMTRYIGAGVSTWTGERWLERTIERRQKDGLSFLAVELKPCHTFIAQIGLLLQDVEGKKEVEVGYHLFPEYWGNGYATEAAKACMEWGFKNLKVPRIISLIAPENKASQNVALRNGLKFDREISFREEPAHLYVLENPYA